MLKQKLQFLLIASHHEDIDLIEQSLKQEMDVVFYAQDTFKKGEDFLSQHAIDVVICHVQVPDRDAMEFISHLIENGKKYYFIVIGNGHFIAEKEAYIAGAHDYMDRDHLHHIGVKLKNLVHFLQQKSAQKNSTRLIIDEEKFIVLKNELPYFLPSKEFEMIKMFCSSPEKIFSREEIANQVWKSPLVAKSRIIDVHITQIRKVLGKEIIRSVKKVGYGLRA